MRTPPQPMPSMPGDDVADTAAPHRDTIGVDVGGTSIRAGWLGAPPEDRIVAPTNARGGHDVTARIAQVVGPLVADGRRPATIGVGIPGQVDHRAGTVRHAVNLGIGDDAHPLADDLATRLGVPVVVENDARAAALGAHHLLRTGRRDVADLVYVNLGTGVSAGIIVDGRVHRGAHGLAGEIGHAPSDGDAPCACGMTGCLEAVAGGHALRVRMGDDLRTLFATPSSDPDHANRVATAVARALLHLAASHDPHLFVLGGGVARHAAPAIRTAVAAQTAGTPLGASLLSADRIVTLSDDSHPGLVGAALLGRQHDLPATPPTDPAPAGLPQGALQ